MYMNTNNKLHCCIYIFLLLITFGCTESPIEFDDNEKKTEGIQLRFSTQNVTRASESELSSEFHNDDKIGCIIAEKENNGYTFKQLTEWHYSNGFLILDSIWAKEERKIDHGYGWIDTKVVYGKSACNQTHTSEYIARLDDGSGDEYVVLNKADVSYAFFFYYPVIDDHKMANEYLKVKNKEHITDKEIQEIEIPFSKVLLPSKPNWDEYWEKMNKLNTFLGGQPYKVAVNEGNYMNDEGCNASMPFYSWEEFPMFVNMYQKSEAQHNYSEFMWTRYVVDQKTEGREDIKQENATYLVNLVFNKKNANILVISDEYAFEDIYIKSAGTEKPEQNNNWGLKMGMKINLKTGELSDYDFIALPSADQINKYDYIDRLQRVSCRTAETFYPRCEDNKDGKKYRFVFPPQDDFKAELHWKFSGNDKSYSLKFIDDLGLSKLEENKLYTIYLKKDNWKIEIRDWAKGDNMLIEEDTKEK